MYCCFFSREEEAPVVFSWEARRLEELLEEHGVPIENVELKPLEVYRDDKDRCVVLLYRWVIRGFCPFYDVASRGCRIHPEKPSACRMYPLLLEVPSGRLSVSGACKWIEENMWVTKRGDLLGKIFPSEIEIAKKVFADYVAAVQLLREEGFRKVNGIEGCREILDFEEFVASAGDSRGEEKEGG
ncbi:YkgJ family cysteine cluster protein [Pyrolobus fumarii]|nr:YkgJ family cysteine cluster protein [Pyrolobus fumarii]